MKRPLHALTLIQPWAWAIAYAGKDVENRSWHPPRWLVGNHLAIHAGKKIDEESIEMLAIELELAVPRPIVTGAIVAVARVLGDFESADTLLATRRYPGGTPWYVEGAIGWMLDDVVAIEPVPCRGAQGLWPVPHDVVPIVRERWEEARRARG
jgi:hypothetical protein